MPQGRPLTGSDYEGEGTFSGQTKTKQICQTINVMQFLTAKQDFGLQHTPNQ
jgi:hypothetical protein